MNSLEAEQLEEQEEMQRRALADAEDAAYALELENPNLQYERDLRYRSAENEALGQEFSREEQRRIRALENVQRLLTRHLRRRRWRQQNPREAAREDRRDQHRELAEFGRPQGGRRHRKTRKHSRKHTKKNRKVSRRKMTRRRR